MNKTMHLLINPRLLIKRAYHKLIVLFRMYILKDDFTISLNKWFKDKGDDILRLDYPELNKKSIVFDLGGYKGDFAQMINQKYGCKVYLFEPHPEFYKFCEDRFSSNKNIITLNYGLSNESGTFTLFDQANGSSFVNPNHNGSEGIQCEVKEFFGAVSALTVDNIDLMKVNIEGGEFDLLLHIAERNRVDLVEQYQIQFHDFIDGAVHMRHYITNELAKTHTRTWCYTFVWENWKRK